MRGLIELAQQIQNIYDQMGAIFKKAQLQTGLLCIDNCGECCLSPNVEASVLEMLPMALELYQNGKWEDCLAKINANEKQSCVLYHRTSQNGGNGYCSCYHTRPNLCRQFGVAAWKHKGDLKLSICKKIKQSNLEKINFTNEQLSQFPLMSTWTYQVNTLHPILGSKILPINQALKEALNIVLTKSFYTLREVDDFQNKEV